MIRLAVVLIVGFAIYSFLPGILPMVRTVAFMGFSWLALATVVAMFLTYRITK